MRPILIRLSDLLKSSLFVSIVFTYFFLFIAQLYFVFKTVHFLCCLSQCEWSTWNVLKLRNLEIRLEARVTFYQITIKNTTSIEHVYVFYLGFPDGDTRIRLEESLLQEEGEAGGGQKDPQQTLVVRVQAPRVKGAQTRHVWRGRQSLINKPLRYTVWCVCSPLENNI